VRWRCALSGFIISAFKDAAVSDMFRFAVGSRIAKVVVLRRYCEGVADSIIIRLLFIFSTDVELFDARLFYSCTENVGCWDSGSSALVIQIQDSD
jgi:hypothetical protein